MMHPRNKIYNFFKLNYPENYAAQGALIDDV